jgi:hypothetical protein
MAGSHFVLNGLRCSRRSELPNFNKLSMGFAKNAGCPDKTFRLNDRSDNAVLTIDPFEGFDIPQGVFRILGPSSH